MVAHSPIVAGTLIAERQATVRREAAEDRVSRLARLYARLAHRQSGVLADGAVVAQWAVQASSADLEAVA